MFIKYVEFSNYWGKSTHRKSDRKKTFCSWPYSLFDSPNEMWGEGHSRCTKGSGLSRVMSRVQSKEELREWIIGVFLRPTALLIGPEKFIMHQVLPEDRGIPEGFLLMKIQGKMLPIQCPAEDWEVTLCWCAIADWDMAGPKREITKRCCPRSQGWL